MAAISSVIMSFTGAGDRILAHRNLYGSTFGFLNHLVSRYGVKTDFVNMTDLDLFETFISPQTKVVYFETPTNPSLEIIDIKRVSEIAHAHGVKVVVDNTFATPVFQRPLELGADVVIHSVTKYISGHGDVVGGFATSKDFDYVQRLKFGFMCELGGVMSPFNAWLLLRGLKTLSLRMDRHASNAMKIANYLNDLDEVERVIYPSLPEHPGHKLAATQMNGSGGIVSFELRGDRDKAETFVKNLELIKLAVSLGDAETLVEVPAMMTHRDYPEEELHIFGFSGKTIRISAGLEHPDDLIDDIEGSLKKVFH
jgi:methionine-gamma-lyase